MTNDQKIKMLAEVAEALDAATTVEELKNHMSKMLEVLRDEVASNDFAHLEPA